MSLLLLYPPAAKASEPPPGIARLIGTLKSRGIEVKGLDLNLQCTLDLLQQAVVPDDTWSQRAGKNRQRHFQTLRSGKGARSFATYVRMVNDLNRILEMAGQAAGIELSLANYADPALSPLSSKDLMVASKKFARNIYYPFFSKILAQELSLAHYDYVGISINYLSQALTGFAIAGFLRTTYPHLKIIAGGGLINSWLHKPDWSDPFHTLFDHCIGGCGEKPLLKYLNADQTGPVKCLPDYSDFHLADYLSPGVIIPYSSADGCYWNKCKFCPDQVENNPYEPLPPTTVQTETHALHRLYQPHLLHFLDNAIPPATLRGLAADPPGPAWYGFVRAEKLLLDRSFCMGLAASGCVMLKIGVESGSQQVLDQMRKGTIIENVRQILENLNRAKIGTYVYLLFGTPYETEHQAWQTSQFIEQNINHISYLNLAIFNMVLDSNPAAFPYDRMRKEDLSLYQHFTHPHGWDRQKIRRFIHSQFRRNERISKILQNDPPHFTSNHAPFFTEGYQVRNRRAQADR